MRHTTGCGREVGKLLPYRAQSTMRQSLAANKTPYASVNVHPAATTKLLEKKKEYDAVAALERASALYLQRIDGLADDLDVMADAGQGV